MRKILIPGFMASIAIFIAGMLVQYVFSAIAPSLSEEVKSFGKFRGWDDPIMYIYFTYPLILGYALAWSWTLFSSYMSGSKVSKVLKFALVYWIVGVIPGMVMTYSSFQLSALMISSWTLGSFMQAISAAIIFSFMLKN